MLYPYTVIVLLICLLMQAGCSPSKESSDSAEEVEFWHIQTYDPTRPAVEAAIKRAEAASPDLAVNAEAIKNDAFKTKLATAMGANDPPDVFHTWGGGALAQYAAAGRVLPLDEDRLGPLDRYQPAALDFCRVDGRLYALPVDVSIVPIWYNTRLFEKAGVSPPQTWEEFLAVCTELKAHDITPLALGNAQSWPGAFYFIYLATRLGGGEAIEAGRFEDPAFIEAGRLLQQLVTADVFNSGFNGLSNDDAQRLFFRGEAAMMLMGTWLQAHLQEQAPELLPVISSFPFPAFNRLDSWDATVVGGVNAAYAIAADTGSPAGAYALLQHLTNDQAMLEWSATGRLPALDRQAAADVLGTPPAAAIALYEASQIQLYYDQLLPPALATAHKETTQALLAGAATPEEAARTMASTAERTNR